jgi:hypothetical protein
LLLVVDSFLLPGRHPLVPLQDFAAWLQSRAKLIGANGGSSSLVPGSRLPNFVTAGRDRKEQAGTVELVLYLLLG